MAPEIFTKNYDYAIDNWSLGCCLYEFVVGEPPFRGPPSLDISPQQMKNIILYQDIQMRDYFSKHFKNLIYGLLEKNPERRLTLQQAKEHPFFKGVDWNNLGKLKAPIDPQSKNEFDVKNIDRQLLQMDIVSQQDMAQTEQSNPTYRQNKQFQLEQFNKFTYNQDCVAQQQAGAHSKPDKVPEANAYKSFTQRGSERDSDYVLPSKDGQLPPQSKELEPGSSTAEVSESDNILQLALMHKMNHKLEKQTT